MTRRMTSRVAPRSVGPATGAHPSDARAPGGRSTATTASDRTRGDPFSEARRETLQFLAIAQSRHRFSLNQSRAYRCLGTLSAFPDTAKTIFISLFRSVLALPLYLAVRSPFARPSPALHRGRSMDRKSFGSQIIHAPVQVHLGLLSSHVQTLHSDRSSLHLGLYAVLESCWFAAALWTEPTSFRPRGSWACASIRDATPIATGLGCGVYRDAFVLEVRAEARRQPVSSRSGFKLVRACIPDANRLHRVW